ncbi:sugar ABC transporter permease [Phytoactinopolyspora halotolerans]|uniref:Xylose transport system permease protein XylH n=1 Tax=Phytoactinopolyspora halotolerans TaxID=1981512 RepID=A0A6L9S352_9ACTN|nr:sugar ABC transporter permease [Phytoactinopolyspora halotolerans]NED99260.1 sugar ABC transporter permease [Phytoactinopolyspora halotolerans]
MRAPRVSPVSLGRWASPFALLVIWIVMTALNPRFLSAVNLTNLMLQIVAVGAIAVGVVLVLLIGEIDLSVGAVSGLGASITAVLVMKEGWPAGLAIATGLATGAVVGLIHAAMVTRIGIPSFVVTLAGLLTWQGALLLVLGDTGSVNVTDDGLTAIAGTFLSPVLGWILSIGVAGAALATIVLQVARGDRSRPWEMWRPGLIAAAALGAVAVFNADRGTPLAVVLFLAVLAVFDIVTRRTKLGRHAVAIGSNASAARRAGIPVDRIRMAVFALASVLAVTGGILAASRLLAVNQSSGGTDLMLTAITAAVIGGTSLFGGRGSVWSALLGSLVVGSLANGLDLLGASSAIRSISTGLVLAVAVALDTLARRGELPRRARGPIQVLREPAMRPPMNQRPRTM